MKLVLNEELPADLRKKLDREAKAEDHTVNDIAVRALSERFDLEWTPSRYHFRPVSARFKLSVPDELHRRIRVEAAVRSQTVRGIVLSILSEHYGTKPIDPHRRRRKST